MPKGREHEYVKKKQFNKLKDQVDNVEDYQDEINDLYFYTDDRSIQNSVKIDNLETNMKKLDKKFKPKTFKRPR